MKLLFECTELSYYLETSGYRAGVFNVALNLFREFKKKNIELVFICNFKRYYFMKRVIEKVPEFQGIELLEEHSFINKFFGLLNYSVRKLPLKFQYAALSISRYYENLFYIRNKQNTNQLMDFDYVFSPFTPFNNEILSSKHLKRFLMLHDIIPILESNKIPTNKRLWCYKLYNDINNKDFYFTNSENTQRDILNYYPFIKPKNITTTLLGANENFRQTCPPLQGAGEFPIELAIKGEEAKERYIFSLCTLGKRKNIIFAIRNFFKFIEKNNIQDLKLVLGGGIWKKFEKELSSSIGNYDKSKLVFTGYIDDDKLPSYYSNALMFVYPSLYEGFGLPVLEAMQCGCPVITSNTSSLPEVIGDAGIKINPTNDEEMVCAFEKMYYDNTFREQCVERGLRQAEKFSWEKCANEILDFINAKLNQPNE